MSKQEIIRKIYTNPETGFVGQDKIYTKAKAIDKSITRKDVKAFFDNFTTTQLHKPQPKEHHLPIIGNVGAYQMDLIFYPKYKSQNKGYSGAFIAVGINSRYAYGYPFKSKAQKDINPILKQFIQDAEEEGKTITLLESDNGSEFVSQSAQKIFQEAGIKHNTGQPGDHNFLGKIDSFSRTIKKRIAQYMTANNTTKWVDVFPDLIYNYNNTIHSAIKLEPAKVSLKKEAKILNNALTKYNQVKNQIQGIEVNDLVRLPLTKAKFEKEGQTYSSELYTIAEVGASKVSVRNSKGNLLRTKYNIDQVLKVPASSIEHSTSQIKEAKKINRIQRQVRKEGLEVDNAPKQYSARKSKLKAYQNL